MSKQDEAQLIKLTQIDGIEKINWLHNIVHSML